MPWKTPDFVEVNLSGEVTAYSNTDDEVRTYEPDFARTEPAVIPEHVVASDRAREVSA